MNNPIFKHAQLIREKERIAEEIKRLEQDSDYKKALDFKKDIDEVLEMHGKTREDLLHFLTSSAPDPSSRTVSHKPKKSLPMKCYTHPKTFEKIIAKSLKDPKLKDWKKEYGADKVRTWATPIDNNELPV